MFSIIHHAQDLAGTGSTLGLSNLGPTPDMNEAGMLHVALVIVLSFAYLYETKGGKSKAWNMRTYYFVYLSTVRIY